MAAAARGSHDSTTTSLVIRHADALLSPSNAIGQSETDPVAAAIGPFSAAILHP